MCFNVVIINPRKRDVRVPVLNLLDFMHTNHDGFSIYTVKNGKEMVYRTLDAKKFVEYIKENVSYNELVHMHFRLASSGTVSLKNVHMWKLEDEDYTKSYYYVSHNGTVSKYSNFTYLDPKYAFWFDEIPVDYAKKFIKEIDEDIESDTLSFIKSEDFNDIVFNDVTQIESVLEKSGFYGVMFLTNPNEVIAISYRKPMYVIISNSVLYFSNTNIKEYVSKTKKIFGFNFKVALETTLYNTLVIFDVKRMMVKKTIKFAPPKYEHYYNAYYIDL